MKELLTLILDELKSASGDLESLIDADFFISIDESIIPTNPTFPLVGVKDGEIDRERVAHDAENWIMEVDIILYQEVKSGDDAHLATSPSTYSILDLESDVRAVLDGNLLGIVDLDDGTGGMLDNFSPASGRSELIGATDLAVQRKVISYWWLKRVYTS